MKTKTFEKATLGRLAEERLEEVLRAFRFRSQASEVRAFYEHFSKGWSSRAVDAPPRWSGVSEDCTPIEFSTVLGRDSAELRLLIEPQALRNTARGCFDQGVALLRRLPQEVSGALDLTRLEQAIPYFRPRSSAAGDPVWFSFFVAASFWRNKGTLLKVYLNPAARYGFARSRSNLGNFLRARGLGSAWETLDRGLPSEAQFLFCSLDLTPEEGDRVKVYCRVPGASLPELESWLALSPSYEMGSSAAAIRRLMGRKFKGIHRPPLMVFALSKDLDSPRASALQLPVFPYFERDAELRRAILSSAKHAGLPQASQERYVRVLRAVANGSLQSGCHYYVSFQRRRGRVRWTVYLSPQFYQERYGRIGLDPERPHWDSSL